MIVRVDLDFENHAWKITGQKNASNVSESTGAPIINLDPNFLIPDEDLDKDQAFFRLNQMQKLADSSLGQPARLKHSTPLKARTRPYRRPDYADEWEALRKAWSLSRNDMSTLVKQRLKQATREFYQNEPLKDLADWLWRFSLFLCQPNYEPAFRHAMQSVSQINDDLKFKNFAEFYERELVTERASRYFEIMKDFFSHYSEFSQVYFFVVRGVDIEKDHQATSTDFASTKMFYGNAFEVFTSQIELLALLNNMIAGRPYDQFEKLSLKEYRSLDKSSRMGPFKNNAAFMAICSEADNQIRNASHHGAFNFNIDDQAIYYRSGKGGVGEERSLSYANYLERCVRIFLQILTLLRMELVICNQARISYPI